MLSPNVVKYIDVGNKVNYELKLIPNTFGVRIIDVPPVIVVVGNPSILNVKVEGRFDFVDSYHLKIEGSTSIGLIIWEASIECPVTTMVPTMKSSCGYLRDMHYIPPGHIPHEAWASGVHKDTHGFNMIKTLPETGKYKQCANAASREMCNCSEKDKLSDYLDVSDCKEKGSELFHFKLSVVPGVTFCELVEEFQVYLCDVDAQEEPDCIYELLLKEGVMVAKKDVHMPKHPELADKNVPNRHVMKAMQSLKSQGYVKEQFAWRHVYWSLTNEGIQYLRDYLHLPPGIVPATLCRSLPETGRPGPKGPEGADSNTYRSDLPPVGVIIKQGNAPDLKLTVPEGLAISE
ncbi:hypothetical protein ACRRTK_017668 [Alexandromys fortis]